MAALFGAFRSEPLTQKLAWFVVVLIPLLLFPSALWLCDALLRQRNAQTPRSNCGSAACARACAN